MAMLGKRELQEALAQRESVIVQRDAEISVLTKRVEELTSQNAQMRGELEDYRARGAAIISALTEAQQSAARIREQAEQEKTNILADAIAQRSAVQKEADVAIQRGREQAERILQEAKAEAGQQRAQAEARLAELEKRAAALRAYICKTAQDAQRRADDFAAFMQDTAGAGTGFAEVDGMQLPPDYESPAALMQSIYAIQGRDLPQETAPETQAATAPEAPADLDAVISEAVDEAAGAIEEDAENKVYTVDDVLGAREESDAEEEEDATGAADGLDAIIDDILKDI